MGAYKLIATFFGIGYIRRGGGTVAALVTCLFLYLLALNGVHSHMGLLAAAAILMAIGTLAATKVEKLWGKDNNRVVVDEVLGMVTSLLFLPINAMTLSAGFIFFRFFDIVKPLGIRKTERLPGGWGVMTDDLLAGLYANICVQALIYFLNPSYYVDIF